MAQGYAFAPVQRGRAPAGQAAQGDLPAVSNDVTPPVLVQPGIAQVFRIQADRPGSFDGLFASATGGDAVVSRIAINNVVVMLSRPRRVRRFATLPLPTFEMSTAETCFVEVSATGPRPALVSVGLKPAGLTLRPQGRPGRSTQASAAPGVYGANLEEGFLVGVRVKAPPGVVVTSVSVNRVVQIRGNKAVGVPASPGVGWPGSALRVSPAEMLYLGIAWGGEGAPPAAGGAGIVMTPMYVQGLPFTTRREKLVWYAEAGVATDRRVTPRGAKRRWL